uniref:GYF domain-containing protein n=1 Tax=Caenorhabditis tropicalis TaxID=1561998 RepID=A0A1I7UHK6_9PELO
MEAMEDTDEDLTIFYTDDSGQTQGPYAASTVLNWYRKGYFRNNHLMRITDNGQQIGNNITISSTLGELKERFGEEKPIPTTIQEVGFRRFCLRPQRNLNLKPKVITIKKEIEDVEEAPPQRHSPVFDDKNTTLPTPRKMMFAGPDLPEEMRKRETSRSPDHVHKSKKTKSSNRTESKIAELEKNNPIKKHKEPHSQQKTPDLPFYNGDRNRDHKRLDTIVAVELAGFLNTEYVRLEKPARTELHKVYSLFKIPPICEICRCNMKLPTNFISHVLSAQHIKKSTERKDRRFTFEMDYLSLKHDIERAKKTSLVHYESETSQPSTSHPRSFHDQPDNSRNLPKKCAQS